MAKTFLDGAGISYEVVDAEEQVDLVKKYGIRQAPTLVVAEGDTAETYVNSSKIKKFVG